MTGIALAQFVSAQMTPTTIPAGVRALSFLRPVMSGAVTAAIIYQPGNAASEKEALSIERALGGGLVVGALTLKARRVPANALSGLAGTRVAFLTKGLNYSDIASATAPRSIVTIGSDPACALAGFCVIAISSVPTVQITVSKVACAAARVSFGSAFLMLVKEV